MKNKEVLLVDVNNVLYASYYSTMTNGNALKNSEGVSTNAVYGFLRSLLYIIDKKKFTHIYFALDKGKATFRHKLYPDYKGTRQKAPDDLVPQFKLIREFLEKSGLGYIELDEFEADDIIGTIATKFAKVPNNNIYIMSRDQDLHQVISSNVFIIKNDSKSSSVELFKLEDLQNKKHINPEQVPDFKGICGDPSDNLKGIKGIGEVGAVKLLSEFKTLEAIYDNLDKIPEGSLKNKLIEGKEDAFFCRKLATINTDIEIKDFNEQEYRWDIPNTISFLRKHNMVTIIKTISSMYDLEIEATPKKPDIKYNLLSKWDKNIIGKDCFLYLEFEKENYHTSSIAGIAFVIDNKSYYLNYDWTNKNSVENVDFNVDDFFDFLRKVNIHTYDAKKLLYFLKLYNKEIYDFKIENDLMLIGYLIDSNTKSTFKNHCKLIDSLLVLKDDEIFGKGAKKTYDIDTEKKANYFVDNANVIKEILPRGLSKLRDTDQLDLYNNIEIPFLYELVNIEHNGVLVDSNELITQTINIETKLKKLEEKIKNIIKKYTEDEINISSPKQLKEFLYETLKLRDNFKGSTDREALESIINDNEIVALLISHRKMSKTLNTYLKGLDKYIEKDNYVRCIYNQTLTATGRLSSQEPNMQNLSVNDEEQKEVRKIFICNKDEILVSLDYSQIELRIVADISKEEFLLQAFNNDEDIHTKTATKIFNVNLEEVTKDQRKIAKTVNFGILYGQSQSALAQELGIDKKEAKLLIANYYEAYPKLIGLKEKYERFAKENGYVTTIGKRRRNIPEIYSYSVFIKNFGKRIAFNSPIQGTAADILKVAIIDIEKNENLDCHIIAQIHDEIIIKCKEKNRKEVTLEVSKIMSNAFKRLCMLTSSYHINDVIIKVNSSYGKNWFELK